jgi:hypothetical protein
MTIAAPATHIRDEDRREVDVRFEEVAQQQWRVVDARIPAGDVAGLLGFVCIAAGLYEVTALSAPLEISYCADERSARALFVNAPAT